MPSFTVTRWNEGRQRSSKFDAPTAGSAVEMAMAEDGVGYEVQRDDRPKEVYELTPNGLAGKLATDPPKGN